MFWIGMLAGFFIGILVGVVLMCILSIIKED